MNPNQLSTELRRVAAKIEASSNPSRELVLKDLKHIVAKAVQSDEQYASWSSQAQECYSEIQKCTQECMSSIKGRYYAQAAEHASALSTHLADFAKMCEGNETFADTLMSEMKKGVDKPGSGSIDE